MKRLVLFDQYPTLDVCAHVCYGGVAGCAYNADCWDEKRAERIEWIKLALTSSNVVHPDKDGPERHKYLLHVPPDEGTNQADEFYCVIVRQISKKTVGFITAYCIDQRTMDQYARVFPRIYPPSNPMTSKKKKRAKKAKELKGLPS